MDIAELAANFVANIVIVLSVGVLCASGVMFVKLRLSYKEFLNNERNKW